MKHLTIALLAALGLWGCTQPADVELGRDGYETDLEVRAVVVPDSNLVVPDVDSTGVLPEDFLSVNGVMLINDITNEHGDQIAITSYAMVFVADSMVRDVGGMRIGFSGSDLGTISLNGQPMVRLPHPVILRRVFRPDTVIYRGWEYFSNLTGPGQYTPGETYSWSFSSPGFGSRTESILSPARVQVQSPPVIGQGVIDRTRDLELLWRGGQGAMSIIISKYDPVTRKTRPLLELRSRANSGRALLPAKILRELPPFQRFFVFTFVLANRREFRYGPNSSGRTLVQAASIVNRYVELR